jgi:hypothetical protein
MGGTGSSVRHLTPSKITVGCKGDTGWQEGVRKTAWLVGTGNAAVARLRCRACGEKGRRGHFDQAPDVGQ